MLKEGLILIDHSPKTMAAGRHMMVWVWYYNGAPQWSTCFDVMVSGSASNPIASAPAASYSAPAIAATAAASSAPVAAAPVAPSPVASKAAAAAYVAPVANDAPAASVAPTTTAAPVVVEGAATTVTEWFTEWTTDYVAETDAPYKAKRHPQAKRHARAFAS
jgi:hypothetical protein